MKIGLPNLFRSKAQATAAVENKADKELEIKSYGAFGMPYSNVYAGFGWYELVAFQSLVYFRNCSPVFNGVDLIAEKVADIRPYVYDTKKKKYVNNHPVLDLLNHPFGDTTYSEFMKELCIFYLVTGNNYTVLTGNVKREPLEMMNIHPGEVIIAPSPRDGYNGTYNVNRYPNSSTFNRREKGGYWRYINDDQQQELWQIRTFNARDQYNTGYYGMSRLLPIVYEIEQHLHSSRHNLSLLVSGAKLSMIVKTLQPLPEEQLQAMRSQISAAYQGSANTGKVMLINGGFDVEEMGMNNTDMDFLNLKKDITYGIYNTLKIPLPLIAPDHSTMNNLEKSMLMLYDNAVLPMAKRAFEELTMYLMPRYPGSENLILKYKEEEITALEPRRMENLKFKKELKIYTVNEMRALVGEKPLKGQDADSVFMPASEVPIANVEDIDLEKDLTEDLTKGRVVYTDFANKKAK
jgi:HK97 family phage portal protein